MYIQRHTAYRNFIQALLNSPSNKAIEIVGANQDLIDSGLVQTMEEVSVELADRGKISNDALANWAKIQNYLAYFIEFIPGDRANNIEKSLAYCENALQVLTREAFPREWASTKKSLGAVYLKRIRGEEAENLELAINNCSEALEVCTSELFPDVWAAAQFTRGKAYRQRIRGEQSDNLEEAISCFTASLKVYTREQFPLVWVEIQGLLVFAYSGRLHGEKTDNLDMAISYMENTLQVFTREAFPEQWALTQGTLGQAYFSCHHSDRAENIEKTIACYKKALRVYTREDFPQNWAAIQNNLGAAYTERICGEPIKNLEEAIIYCKRALQVHTRETFPENWAQIQITLGNAYNRRISGERSLNLELAITCYQNALQVLSFAAYPQDWVETQIGLAVAYCERIYGERPENLALAVVHNENILHKINCDDFPKHWAFAQNNLGVIYYERVRGGQVEEWAQAVNCYNNALQIFTYEAYRQQWAEIQMNLGNLYQIPTPTQNDEEDNIENLISTCYENALQFFTREANTASWVVIQANLARFYALKQSGEKSENQERAIACSTNALQVLTREAFPERWAIIQTNLGSIYKDRISGERTENLKRAISCYENAVQILTREAFPHKWVTLQGNLGQVYEQNGQVEKAIQTFQDALKSINSTAFPWESLNIGRDLGNTAFNARLWPEALKGYTAAIDGLEQVRTYISSELQRQELVAGFTTEGIYEKMVQACINDGQLGKALQYAERSRSKMLVDLMKSNDLDSGGEIPPQVQQNLEEYEALQQQLEYIYIRHRNNLNNTEEMLELGTTSSTDVAIQADNETIATLESEKQQVWQKLRKLDPVLAGQIQVSPLELIDMRRLIEKPNTAILSFYTISSDTHIFVLRKNGIQLHTCTGQGIENLQIWIVKNWLSVYKNDNETWENNISNFLTKLAQCLQINKLITEHLEGIEELILVPHIYLHLIPFAALPLEENEYLGDKFLIRYTPSCQVLDFCKKRPPVETALKYGTVEDATDDLPCASFECEEIAQLYDIPNQLRLKGSSQATKNNYRQLVKHEKVQVLHSSHHASSRLDQPLESILLLANGEKLTLGELLTPGWRVPDLLEVFLSCCETNVGNPGITDDILTIGFGFLCAGARSVVSTLWSVDELATAIFCILYYQYRKDNKEMTRPAALQKAQQELRNLTGKNFESRYKESLTKMLDEKLPQAKDDLKKAENKLNDYPENSPEYLEWEQNWDKRYKIVNKIKNAKNRLTSLCSEEYPFSHPIYWAGFNCSGLR
ncbi:MAG: CHAT domain-containing protein [Microcoleus anatoxicus]|uniref:CHAT domain-containing protein n=1 Tax=Microcoleus anatoxicus TaxID=2705319 RepID=UPI00366E19DA